MSQKPLLLLVVFNILATSVLTIIHFVENEKLVYIDSGKVINAYQGMVDARKAYQEKISVWKANVDTLALEVQNEIVRYDKESVKMTMRERELSRELIKTKQQQLKEYQQSVNDRANQEDAAATKKVIDEINAFIKAYGEQHNYAIVFAATEYGNIAYAKEYLDITPEVIEGINKKYKGL